MLMDASAYTFRVWQLSSHNKTLSGTIMLLIVSAFGLGFFPVAPLRPKDVLQVTLGHHGTFLRLLQLSTTAVGDILITCSLVYYLRADNHQAYFPRTRSLIDRLVAYCVVTGLATSILSIASIATVGSDLRFGVAPPLSEVLMVGMLLYTLCGSMYINTYLASLNLRASLRNLGRPHSARFINADDIPEFPGEATAESSTSAEVLPLHT
ncbi:hypothetical protein HGRIS_014456 [Hohenbuehelia grisea]|uniref:DUF6534 domain-containing protein n=1 Tax=Hohenbuehelia grisea TaxID=104357 RepID=A0ABR3JVN0_9AGAR